MFRSDEVAGSWPALIGRLDARGVWPAWVAAESALSAVEGPAGLPAALARGQNPERSDALLGALVRLAAADGGDDPDAVLLVLHLLADGAAALARKVAHRCADSLLLVVGELTCQIRSFPWRRRTRAYAANLLLDTKHALWVGELRPPRDHPGPDDAVPVDPTNWANLVEHRAGVGAGVGAVLDPHDDPGPDLVDLLTWAAGRGVARADELMLLWELEHRVEFGGAAHRDTARELGIDERTLRRRRGRTLTALRNCAPDYQATVA